MEFEVSAEFKTTPDRLYSAWLNSKKHSAMTGSDATVSDEVDGQFTAWDGYIEGQNLELVPNFKIRQAWRTTEFPDDQEDSMIEITLEEVRADVTKLTLKHTHLSDKDEQYIQGWKDNYFIPMKKYFDKQ